VFTPDQANLMIRNGFTFNPSNTLLNQAGGELQRLLDDKWKGLPPLQAQEASEEEEEDEDVSDEEHQHMCTCFLFFSLWLEAILYLSGAIAVAESQIETMKNSIESLKTPRFPRRKRRRKSSCCFYFESSSQTTKAPRQEDVEQEHHRRRCFDLRAKEGPEQAFQKA
jgi:bromodomain-containing factor 1